VTTATKLFGEQILDEIRGQGLTYSIFAQSERERLSEIESRSELRAFYDELGYDCITVLGSPSEIVRTLKQQRYSSANSRGWQSLFEREHWKPWLIVSLGYSLISLLLKLLVNPERPLFSAAASSSGTMLGILIVFAGFWVFERYRLRKRERMLKVLRETESHI